MKSLLEASVGISFVCCVAAACGGLIRGDNRQGEEHGSCYANGACSAGLSCLNNLCVDAGSTSSAGSPDGASGMLVGSGGGSVGSGGSTGGSGGSGGGGSNGGSGGGGSSGSGNSSGVSSSSSGSVGDCGALSPRDVATLDAGSPIGTEWACFERRCAMTLLACASEACCNNAVVGALDCAAEGGTPSICFTPVASVDTASMNLIACLLQNNTCAAPFDASAGDGSESESGAD